MRWQLPSPRAIIALESVVRTGSVTAAAEELCVTQSAISKQIAALEDWLGRPLFEENRRLMVPTEAARRLADAAGVAWGLLAAAVDEVGQQSADTPLQVLAPASFSMRWLLPHLPRFQAEFPDAKLSVRQTHTPDLWAELPFDVVIRRGDPVIPALHGKTFLREELVLVAKAGSDWTSATRLDRLKFLEAETRPGELFDWLRAACAAASLHLSRPKPVRFAHFYIALEAALAGQGVLVAPDIIVADLIREGMLEVLFPGVRIPGPAYWIGYQPSGAQAAASRAFSRWLLQAALDWAAATKLRTADMGLHPAA